MIYYALKRGPTQVGYDMRKGPTKLGGVQMSDSSKVKMEVFHARTGNKR